MAEKKDSLLVRKVVEQVQEFDNSLVVEGINIDGRKYNIEVCNVGQDKEKCLLLKFRFEHDRKDETPRYIIWIDKKGIKFEKGIYDDGDIICGGEGIEKYNLLEKKSGKDKGKLSWSRYFPDHPEEEDFFRVPFVVKKEK